MNSLAYPVCSYLTTTLSLFPLNPVQKILCFFVPDYYYAELLMLHLVKKESMANFLISLKHPIERKGMRYIIEGAFRNSKVQEANIPNAILKLLKKNKVDLFICDIFQGEDLRIEWIQQLGANFPALPILIFSGHSEEIYGVRLIKAGASGCISNDCEPEVLIKCGLKSCCRR